MLEHRIAHAPRVRALAKDMSCMTTTCIGCTDCGGICQAMVDVVMVPRLVLQVAAPHPDSAVPR